MPTIDVYTSSARFAMLLSQHAACCLNATRGARRVLLSDLCDNCRHARGLSFASRRYAAPARRVSSLSRQSAAFCCCVERAVSPPYAARYRRRLFPIRHVTASRRFFAAVGYATFAVHAMLASAYAMSATPHAYVPPLPSGGGGGKGGGWGWVACVQPAPVHVDQTGVGPVWLWGNCRWAHCGVSGTECGHTGDSGLIGGAGVGEGVLHGEMA